MSDSNGEIPAGSELGLTESDLPRKIGIEIPVPIFFEDTEVLDLATRQLQWIRPAQQVRTQQTLVRLLDSAEALLEDKGFDDLSVSEIAGRAGSSVGAFYRRLKDKDALLHALHERYCEEGYATTDAALEPERWAGSSIEEIVSEVIRFLIEIFNERVGLERAIYQRTLVDPTFRERSVQLNRYVSRGWGALLLSRRDEIMHPEPEMAVDFAIRTAFAFLMQHYSANGADIELVPLSDERTREQLVRTLLAYLGVDPGRAD